MYKRQHPNKVKTNILDNAKIKHKNFFIRIPPYPCFIFSIIGNIFDNAISYLTNHETKNKEIIFSIERTGFYSICLLYTSRCV